MDHGAHISAGHDCAPESGGGSAAERISRRSRRYGKSIEEPGRAAHRGVRRSEPEPAHVVRGRPHRADDEGNKAAARLERAAVKTSEEAPGSMNPVIRFTVCA